MSFNARSLALAGLLLPSLAWAGISQSREESLAAIFRLHGEMAGSLSLMGDLKPVKFRSRSFGGKKAKVAVQPRNLVVKASTVFGSFDVRIVDFGTHFTLNIHSENPAEELVVKDSRRNIILYKHALNDETDFSAQIGAPLTRDIGVSVAVAQKGSLNDAYFKLLGGAK